MHRDDWHLTEDGDAFLARAGDFLRSRPTLHNIPLTMIERLRTRGANADATVLGWLEREGEVRAVFYRRPTRRLSLTSLTPKQAGALATHLADLGYDLSGVTADHGTAAAFATTWQRHTGATPVPDSHARLYRLGTLTPPEPVAEGRGRVADVQDHEQLVRWCSEFVAAVGEAPAITADSWAGSRFADKHFTFWETGTPHDVTPVAMAGSTSMVAGMIRVDPVYTPARFRGRGYGAAVTVEVSRAALAVGARDVVLFTNPANATSNALYQRLGYVPVADFAGYGFSGGAPESGC